MWSPETLKEITALVIGTIGALAGAYALVLGGKDKLKADAKEAAPPPKLDKISMAALGGGLSEYFAAEGMASTGERIALAMEGIAKTLAEPPQRRMSVSFTDEDRHLLREGVQHLESIADDIKRARRDHEP